MYRHPLARKIPIDWEVPQLICQLRSWQTAVGLFAAAKEAPIAKLALWPVVGFVYYWGGVGGGSVDVDRWVLSVG